MVTFRVSTSRVDAAARRGGWRRARVVLGFWLAATCVPPGLARAAPAGSGARATAHFREDCFEVRLTPVAARAADRARLTATPGRRLAKLGLARMDALAEALGGVSFEPEFLGETAPPAGSNAVDFTTFWVAHLPDAGI